jgi:hypothetical protein
MMITKSSIVFLIILLGLFRPVSGQEQPLKDYADAHKESKFCFYPSTLRMINIAQNPDYNDLVNGIEKLLVYSLDSSAKADQSYKDIINSYREIGFEEYAAMYGGKTNFFLYGKENKDENQFVGVMKSEDEVYAFYMRGQIGWQKIPALMQNFQSEDVMNIFDLKQAGRGNHTRDN